MLLPDPENLPEYVAAALAALHAALGPAPPREAVRAATRHLPPRVRRYLRELRIRAEVAEEVLRMIASGEAPGLRLDDDRPQAAIDAEARWWLARGVLDALDTPGELPAAPPAGPAESL